MAQLQKGHALFRAGENVPFRGQYIVVDEAERQQDFRITLEAGEHFPTLQGADNLFYTLEIEEGATSTDNAIPLEKALD